MIEYRLIKNGGMIGTLKTPTLFCGKSAVFYIGRGKNLTVPIMTIVRKDSPACVTYEIALDVTRKSARQLKLLSQYYCVKMEEK